MSWGYGLMGHDPPEPHITGTGPGFLYQPAFRPNMRITVFGLDDQPHLNGEVGSVSSRLKEETGCHEVFLTEGRGSQQIKPENLRLGWWYRDMPYSPSRYVNSEARASPGREDLVSYAAGGWIERVKWLVEEKGTDTEQLQVIKSVGTAVC